MNMRKRLYLIILGLFVLSISANAYTIHLMGDSTCAEKDLSKGSPERGWGMMLQNFLDDDVRVIN